MRRIILVIMFLSVVGGAFADNTEQRIDEIISRLTLRQKLGQLNQLDGRGTLEQLRVMIRRGELGSVMNVTEPAMVNELQKIACEESESKIPLVFARDVVHGFKTMLPIPLGLAATFNPQMVELGARISAVEATEHGVKWAFAPMMDVARDARWGRIAESFGEDTHLNSVMASAMVRGYQGDNLAAPNAMAACAKHFVGYGASEGGRDYNTTYIPMRQLREVYLPPFEASLKAGCASVMTAFNDNNGTPCSADKELLTHILRDEWGFDGVVVSDWGAVRELIRHGVAENRDQAAVKALRAGVDVDMSSSIYIECLEKLVRSGAVDESEVDRALRNVLRLKIRLGLFDSPYVTIAKSPKTGSAEHLKIAREAATQSVVLLKNDNNTLPISRGVKHILVVGPLADAPHDQLGTWTMDGDTTQTQTPARAIAQLCGKDVKVTFIEGLLYSRDKSRNEFARIAKAATEADMVVAFVGEEAILTGEAHSLADISLKGAQSELIELLAQSGRPLVTVFMAGRQMVIGRECELSDAALYSFHPGTMGGPAIADILFGRACPSGKLPVTFPKMSGQTPIYYNQRSTGRPASGNEKGLDEIPVNARQSVLGHSSYYLDAGSKPQFTFGYGLSYTSFELSDLKILSPQLSAQDTVKVEVTLRNSGKMRGAEVVQLYVRDVVASVTRPVRELMCFERMELSPGQSEVVRFSLSVAQLGLWNAKVERVVEPGKFVISVGTGCGNDLSSELVLM